MSDLPIEALSKLRFLDGDSQINRAVPFHPEAVMGVGSDAFLETGYAQ